MKVIHPPGSGRLIAFFADALLATWRLILRLINPSKGYTGDYTAFIADEMASAA
jgi:hypothetical protein